MTPADRWGLRSVRTELQAGRSRRHRDGDRAPRAAAPRDELAAARPPDDCRTALAGVAAARRELARHERPEPIALGAR